MSVSFKETLFKPAGPLGLLVFVLILFSMLELVWGRNTMFLAVNQFVGISYLDSFFTYITLLGDGWTHGLVIIFALFFTLRWAFVLGLSVAMYGPTSVFLKRVIFPELPRPSAVFGIDRINTIEQVHLHSYQSFPSGHSMTSIALAVIAIYFFKDKRAQYGFALLGLLAAFSRIFIGQHYFSDVGVGGIIGLTASMLAYWLIQFVEQKRGITWFDQGLKDL